MDPARGWGDGSGALTLNFKNMRTIIAGSRSITDGPSLVDSIIKESKFDITEVICGMARGVDLAGKEWAESRGIPVREMPAQWDTFGKRAGVLRNIRMAESAEALIVIWDGKSRGSWNMIETALARGLSVFMRVHDGLKRNDELSGQ